MVGMAYSHSTVERSEVKRKGDGRKDTNRPRHCLSQSALTGSSGGLCASSFTVEDPPNISFCVCAPLYE